jgi:hypothetical protein
MESFYTAKPGKEINVSAGPMLFIDPDSGSTCDPRCSARINGSHSPENISRKSGRDLWKAQ